jgi:hypothetical protein
MKGLNAVLLGAAIAAVGTYAAGCASEGPDALDVPYDYSSGSGNQGGSTGQGGSTSSTTTQSAEDFYQAQVHDDLLAECSSCHGLDQSVGPQWLEVDADSAYATLKATGTLVNAPDCSLIMTKSKGEHAGPSLTADLEDRVVQWLQLEASENGLTCGGGNTGGGALEQCNLALADFQECMSFAYFEVSGAYDVANQGTEMGPCHSCHEAGTGGAKLSIDPLSFFNAHQTDEYFLIKMVRCAISGGEFQGLQAALRFDNKGTEPCNNPSGNCHPSYVLTPERSDAMQMYIEDTIDAINNGTCQDLDDQAQQQLNN